MTQPISAVVPTANRPKVLQATLSSLAQQSVQPAEIIIVDASEGEETKLVCEVGVDNLQSRIVYQKAVQKGAASQRNEGVDKADFEFILFFDDDIFFEPFCIERLWNGINTSDKIGGINCMVTNQRYLKPGKLTSMMYHIMNGEKLKTYAGKCIGPAWNLLPEDDNALPEINKTEWINTTCTLYRKEALPNPVFPEYFKGYSMMEDLTLSSIVGRNYDLYNARTARIFHDSQPGSHKNNLFEIAKMETVNRHFVMVNILNRKGFKFHVKLVLLEMFFILSNVTSLNGLKKLPLILAGKITAIPATFSNTDK